MIITCKYCRGTGRFLQNPFEGFFGGQAKPCIACKGAGELVLPSAAENYVICKLCKGTGSIEDTLNVLFAGNRTLCSACKGAGVLTRPILHGSHADAVSVDYGQAPRPSVFKENRRKQNRKQGHIPFFLTGKGEGHFPYFL
ncbi:MAG: hypothetical protein Q8M34_03715 [Thermodesulfovibrionales bacterium]|nr:hypothetical protein [Thermodesulfovibrionales bacterium]